jgi:SpoVK/Ycf46/Vps4 family AAA+-type ATPase
VRELCLRAQHQQRVMQDWGFEQKLSLGKGVNALFSGPSGTGKTMAAEIIAGELGLDLYTIDLAQVVSKYIGETEKNLDRIFAAAEAANCILFFDEADALFGKRSEVKDSHDRYANLEISYLLQRIEQHEGFAILATNLPQNLDEAFVRRLAFTIPFPFPDEPQRRRIWQRIWPAALPLDASVDSELLATLKMSGGSIKNVALAAAFLAASDGGTVGLEHVRHATQREYQKLGKAFGAAELSRGAPAQ